MTDKPILRKEFITRRSAISDQDAVHFSNQAADLFSKHISLDETDIVALYHPIKNEITPLPLLKRLNDQKTPTCLPVIVEPDAPLAFRAWEYGDKLITNEFFNLKEPDITAPDSLPTIMVVPLLAFDERGYRLGYGGGFYDRTIHAFKDNNHRLTTIGLAYSCQRTHPLPNGEFDQLLDFVITEKDVFKF